MRPSMTFLRNKSDKVRALDPHDYRFNVTFPNELRIVFKSYSSMQGDQATVLLQYLNHTHVVLYDADVSFVRSVEHSAFSSSPPSP